MMHASLPSGSHFYLAKPFLRCKSKKYLSFYEAGGPRKSIHGSLRRVQ
ncbi:MAG: hypothetical protein RL538_374 [Candidatus Parcubacteria bacterium]|jgi:hypothetical protein